MNTRDFTDVLAGLFSELVDGPPKSGAYILNPGDVGLLGSLDKLAAPAASASLRGGGTIAAHVDHLRFSLSVMNRWAAGENPWGDADSAWRIISISDEEWKALRGKLRDEVQRWRGTLQKPRDLDEIQLNATIGSIVHLAYHLGAIRQIDSATRGPRAPG